MRGSKNCQSSSVVAAYWPGSGSSLHSIDHIERRIGVIQYFVNHTVEFYRGHARERDYNMFFVMYSGKSSTRMKTGMDFLRLCVMTVLSYQMHAVSCLYEGYLINVLLLNLMSILKALKMLLVPFRLNCNLLVTIITMCTQVLVIMLK